MDTEASDDKAGRMQVSRYLLLVYLIAAASYYTSSWHDNARM